MSLLLKLYRVSLLAVCLPAIAAADINEAITAALAHYSSGELMQAVAQLDYAAALIRQEKGEHIKSAFPQPPTGWQADTAEITSAALFGGMLSVSRRYYHRSSNQNIYLSVTLESPLEQQALLMMLSNPSMVTMSGGKLIKVKGLTAVQRLDNNQLEIKFRTESGAVVKIEGHDNVELIIYELLNRLDFILL